MSQQHLSPYINFQGRAREAMEFYHKVFGGNLDLQTLNERGEPKAAGLGDRIMHARLEADGASILGSDGHSDYPAKVGDNMALAVRGTDRDRLTKIFNNLAEGGYIKGPLTKQPWGSDDGWLADQFGINWVVSIEKA